ncbi:MAG: ABC transporter permease [Gemmatimonadota bacterium]|nr:ABC transporter permease [Gemmatimonadota bacterium]
MLSPTPPTPETPDRFVRFSIRFVGAASRLLPSADRRAWRAEWNAEILAAHDRLARGRGVGTLDRLRLVVHAVGSLRDAWYLTTHGFGLRNLFQDLGRAGRSLRSRPGFTATAVVTLMLGIGANTALLGIVRGVLLRPFPYDEPDRLVQLIGHRIGEPGRSTNVSYPNLADIESEVSAFSGVAGISAWQPAFTEGAPEVLPGATVSWDYFDVLGVRPAAGRFFVPDEEGEGRTPTVVISHGLWTRRFGADPDLPGSSVLLNNEAYVVAGVTPADFEGPNLVTYNGRQPEVWRTPYFDAVDWFRSGRSWRGVARLADGVDVDGAQPEVRAAMARLADAYPEENADRTMTLAPLRDSVVGDTRTALYVLMGAVGLVLLVACVNVANLLTGRMLERREELLVRSSMGASRGRLVTHLFAESLAIALVGGVLGVALAYGTVGAIVGLAGQWLPRADAIEVDAAVLAFSAALAGGTAILFGLLPALRIAGSTPLSPVGGSRGGEIAGRAERLRRGLVLAQVATTLVLVVGAGLLLQSFANLHGVDLGVQRRGVLTLEMHGAAWWDLEPEAAEDRYREVLERIEALPGVMVAGAMDVVPLSDNYSCDGVTPLDRPPPGPGEGRCAEVRSVTPGALDALDARLVTGRGIEWRDGADAAGGMVISAAMAEMFWPGESAIGKSALIHSDTFAVLGVVADIRHFGPETPPGPMAFLPASQEPWNGIARGLSVVVRGDAVVESMGDEIRAVINSIEPRIAISSISPMGDLLAGTVGGPRLRATLLAIFAALALVLALVGIAGVMAQAVSRRRREIGVRIALGAAPGGAISLVLRDGVRLTSVGLAVGLLAAAALTRLLESFVFGVSPLEPRVLAAGCLLVFTLGVLCSWLPARRAARIDPVEALRAD